MQPTIRIVLVQEGRHLGAYDRTFWELPAILESKTMVGLGRIRAFSPTPLWFNVEQPSTLDGVRERRVAVAVLDKDAAASLNMQEGYYPLKMAVDHIKKLKLKH